MRREYQDWRHDELRVRLWSGCFRISYMDLFRNSHPHDIYGQAILLEQHCLVRVPDGRIDPVFDYEAVPRDWRTRTKQQRQQNGYAR